MRVSSTLAVLVFALMVACSPDNETSRNWSPAAAFDSDVLREKLVALGLRTNEYSFVIIEEADSRKYVQFTGTNIFFDLPKQTLSDQEMIRAEAVLKRFGVTGPVTYRLGRQGEGPEQTSFQKDLAGDVSEAVAIVKAVLFEVYGFTNTCFVRYEEY